jgi:hypothetical protein
MTYDWIADMKRNRLVSLPGYEGLRCRAEDYEENIKWLEQRKREKEDGTNNKVSKNISSTV